MDGSLKGHVRIAAQSGRFPEEGGDRGRGPTVISFSVGGRGRGGTSGALAAILFHGSRR